MLLNLSLESFALLALVCFIAGVVRGFAGFALSALVMAAAVFVLPPVQLLPVVWWLELTASLLMLRNRSWRSANHRMVIGLMVGSVTGVPIGLYLTTTLSVAHSRNLALSVILVLACLQLLRLRITKLATKLGGLYGYGLLAGIATGVAGVGGLVVALYVLASNVPAAKMRASLVLFLCFSGIGTLISLLAYRVMDLIAVYRGVSLSIPVAIGVIIGSRLFTPRYASYYRPFCLLLLILLALWGLLVSALK